jgi:hypothetical protein
MLRGQKRLFVMKESVIIFIVQVRSLFHNCKDRLVTYFGIHTISLYQNAKNFAHGRLDETQPAASTLQL